MKKVFTAILMAMTMSVAQAQVKSSDPGDVYYEVKNGAELALEDPEVDESTQLLCQFKLAALRFLVKQGVKETNGKGYSLTFMDKKAYALNHFLTKYLTEINNLTGNADAMKGCIKTYWKATHKNPMYPNYQEDNTTQAFLGTLLCFSLNTDWEKADEATNK